MAVTYNETLRNNRLDEVTAFAGNAALLRIYSGTRPAFGGSAGVLLAELTCGTPFAPPATGGVLTANEIADDTAANASGIATWFRVVQSNGTTAVLDGDAGTSGTDLVLSNTNFIEGGNVSIESFTISGGNA